MPSIHTHSRTHTHTHTLTSLTHQEWERELDDLLELLTQQDGRAVLHVDQDAHNFGAWAKLYAIYGEVRALFNKVLSCNGVNQACPGAYTSAQHAPNQPHMPHSCSPTLHLVQRYTHSRERVGDSNGRPAYK